MLKLSKQQVVTWTKALTVTSVSQIAIKAIGFLSAIIVIRLLPTQEYAYYTLAYTMLGTMTLLADAGIGIGMLRFGSRVWDNRTQLGRVLTTALNLRYRFACLCLLLFLPILFILLRHHGATWLAALIIIAALIPAFYTSLSESLLKTPIKLNKDITRLQVVDVGANSGRLALTATCLCLAPFAWVGILCSGIAQIYVNIRYRTISHDYVDRTAPEDPEVRQAMLGIVKRKLPGSIYYCVSSQITIWLISIFGTTDSVAQFGALTRLAMLLTVFHSIMSLLVVPSFAKLPDNGPQLRKHYLALMGGLSLMSIAIFLIVALTPNQILWVLGGDYTDLREELILMAMVSCVGFLGNCNYSLTTARGMVMAPYVGIPILLTVQIIAIVVLPLGTVKEVLVFSLINACASLALIASYFVYKTHHLETDAASLDSP